MLFQRTKHCIFIYKYSANNLSAINLFPYSDRVLSFPQPLRKYYFPSRSYNGLFFFGKQTFSHIFRGKCLNMPAQIQKRTLYEDPKSMFPLPFYFCFSVLNLANNMTRKDCSFNLCNCVIVVWYLREVFILPFLLNCVQTICNHSQANLRLLIIFSG